MTALLEPALSTYSACRLCQHSAEHGIELVCEHPEHTPFTGAQPVTVLRTWGGDCGPNAKRMEPRYINPTARAL